jgi:CubicO group peptidase (beta-lactamase class C family)
VAVDAARRILQGAIGASIFPGAAVDVGSGAASLWRDAVGGLTFSPDAPSVEVSTPFDLASLTKVIATTSVVMEHVRTGRLTLDEPLAAIFSEWRGADRDAVTIRDLLEHSSGLPARLFDASPAGRREFEHEICTIALEYAPRARSIYSDLGFILLGFLASDRARRSLAEEFESTRTALAVAEPSLAFEPLGFGLSEPARQRASPTRPLPDDVRRGRTFAGDVHDNYAAALGGVAGHAGLFGTAGAVAAFARTILRAARGQDSGVPFLSPSLVALFTARTNVPGSSRALGWDTMLPTSSCGTRMSHAAFGHVGFTGASLWIDPMRDRYFVLLTNRAYGSGSTEEMRSIRRAFHDALGEL